MNAVPGADLGGLNLAFAFLIGKDLHGAYAWGADLSYADLSHANLMNAVFRYAYLIGANLTARKCAAPISPRSISPNLHRAALFNSQLPGPRFDRDQSDGPGSDRRLNFAGQNLTNSFFCSDGFDEANVHGADFTGAEIRGAVLTKSFAYNSYFTLAELYSTASYQAHDLRGVTLRGFFQINYADADYTGIDIRGANLCLTLAQLYSTASYQAHDLTGIRSDGSNLTGADFAGQNLTNANLDWVALDGKTSPTPRCVGPAFQSNSADYPDSGITLLQLYSTASYQDHDLRGITLFGNHLSAANFAGQNLSGATSMPS